MVLLVYIASSAKTTFFGFDLFLKEIRLHNVLKTDRKSYILHRLV